jgi:hypothetical protein
MTTSVKTLYENLQENHYVSETDLTLLKPMPIRKTESIKPPFSMSGLKNEANIPLLYPQFQYGNLGLNSHLKINPQMMFHDKIRNKKLLDLKVKPCCSCIKTKCMKKYCECFANNKPCKNCICLDCQNKDINKDIKENISNNNKEITFCTCAKSGCNKKYCECFKEGAKCNIKCRCVNCLNLEEKLDKNLEKIENFGDVGCDSGKKTACSEINEFSIQKISVMVGKSQTYIDIEKLSVEDFGLLCKKRKFTE